MKIEMVGLETNVVLKVFKSLDEVIQWVDYGCTEKAIQMIDLEGCLDGNIRQFAGFNWRYCS